MSKYDSSKKEDWKEEVKWYWADYIEVKYLKESYFQMDWSYQRM